MLQNIFNKIFKEQFIRGTLSRASPQKFNDAKHIYARKTTNSAPVLVKLQWQCNEAEKRSDIFAIPPGAQYLNLKKSG